MSETQSVESKASQPVCARCGSQLSSSEGTEGFCVACLLHTALGDADDDAVRSRRFDQYELITDDAGNPIELGRGAMGVTYKAFDTNLRCEVALKVIHPRFLADESSRARFLSEARAAAQLRHRNIASVFHLGSERDEYFYTMELVEGETIDGRVRRKGPIDCATALDITLQVTRALIAAGDRKFVHRDVKPSNIMLCTEADGAIVAKLIDFGLVRGITEKFSRAASGPVRQLADKPDPSSDNSNEVTRRSVRTGFIGTPEYASPEQFAGERTDARSDIYSLGVTLWFMLTGKLPYDGMREEIHRRQLSDALPLDQLKGISRPVVDLIKRMLDPDPAKRPQSPAVLKEQLHKCMAAIDAAKQKQHRLIAYGGLAAVVLIIAALGASYILQRKPSLNTATEAVPEKSIAVLPFENLSDEKEHTFFADGVQDDLLTKLAKIADLKVISRTSVMRYRSRQDSRKIGSELGVSYVLEGTVRPFNHNVHVNARLVDARTGADVWAEEYERNLSEVFAIEAELAQSVARQLGANVSAFETLAIQQQPTQDLVAYDLYTRANNLDLAATFGDNVRGDYLLQAAGLLNQALSRDSSFFQAYCELARVHDRIYIRGHDRTPARLALAEAAIQAAARLRPDAGETHLARAQHFYCGYLDYHNALTELGFARQSLPNNARVFELMARVQRLQGHWKESTRNFERALELNPRDLELVRQIAISCDLLGDYAQEASLLDRALTIDPNHVELKVVRALLDLGWKADTRPAHQAIDEVRAKHPDSVKRIASDWLICSFAERDAAAVKEAFNAGGESPFSDITTSHAFVEGLIARLVKNDEKARAAFMTAREEQDKLVQAQPDFGPAWCVLGLIDAALGRKDEALREGRHAVEVCPVEKDALRNPMMIEFLAMIAAWAGDKDIACEQLAIAVRPPSWVGYGELKLLPWWDPLRGDPRFEKLVASLAPR
ncbi:MAG TPA: FlgO family outer membrane protein [Candidatus Udaeobacter sp.]|jgi:serine/threonine-protein kinase|nr:FlgO family outer membrane protein [Candidatus Udaeobacter sp.]